MPTYPSTARRPYFDFDVLKKLAAWRRRPLVIFVITRSGKVSGNAAATRSSTIGVRCGPKLRLFLEAVVAAFEVCMILVARQQNDSVITTIGELADTRDLTSIVDEEGLY
jgi:hypothetical protein